MSSPEKILAGATEESNKGTLLFNLTINDLWLFLNTAVLGSNTKNRKEMLRKNYQIVVDGPKKIFWFYKFRQVFFYCVLLRT